ncbi:hypothetical protein Q8A67_003778 [Cirrhinus molitorella]|uniref:Uncharacterized protein n=1 Tax=Cirrhinus molitorella TaxID=172907 RepID=A0AA88Q1A8_9TELE|nr:hypothetical protein Q8A67_003778 [Cirrhinus molitorella]
MRQGATTVAPMADNCSPQETPMPRLFTLGLSVPVFSSSKRQVQKGQSQACLFREYKPQASLRQRELKSVKPPQTSPVLECSPQAAPVLQGEPVSECSPAGAPMPKCSLQAAPVIECSSQGAPMPRLFTVVLFIPTFSTRNFHVQKGQSQACLFQKCREYKPQASLRQRAPKNPHAPQSQPSHLGQRAQRANPREHAQFQPPLWRQQNPHGP